MKLRATYSWLCVLLFCFLSSSALLAQDEPADQTSQDISLLFRGTLNDNDADEGNYAIFNIALNAGDQITATALCEMAADGHRLIDPALTVSAPQADDTQERQQWYNDDNDTVSDCVDYSSSLVSFEAPVSGDYEFVIENLANRSGPFSLEILGSTVIQTELDLAPPVGDEELLVESGAEEPPEIVALAADQEDLAAIASSTNTITFTGTLGPSNGETIPDWHDYWIDLDKDDSIVAVMTCEQDYDSRPLDPKLEVLYDIGDGKSQLWENDDHDDETACRTYRSSRVTFTAPVDGEYRFRARNVATRKGRYTLTISGFSTTQPEADTPLWDGTGTDVPGRWATADFEGGEGTLIVNISEGARVAALATCEEDDDGDRPVDPYLKVQGPDGNEITVVDDSLAYQACDDWYSAYVEFEAASTGNYSFIVNDLGGTTDKPYKLVILRQLPSDLPDGDGDGDGGGDGGGDNGGGGGGRACEGAELLGKLGEIGCVFSQQAGSGQRIDVYYVDSNSVGHFVLSVNTNQLGDAPASETQIASGSGGSYTFQVYHKPNGDLRVTGGPSSEGKTYEVTATRSTNSNNNNNNQGSGGTPSSNPTATPESQQVHVVQAGETLYSIATRYGVTVQAIADANGIGSDYIIHVGNSLNIPAP